MAKIEKNEHASPIHDIWEACQDSQELRNMMWVVLGIVLLIVLLTVLPYLFNGVANVVRSYKNMQCALRE
jgi:hypothetical protein